jgi:hypothetical protein
MGLIGEGRGAKAARVPATEAERRAAFDGCDTEALRKILTRPMDPQSFGLPTVVATVMDPEMDASLPPEKPPGIGPPGQSKPAAFVEVSAEFIRSLRNAYGRDAEDLDARKIGRREDVQAWLNVLKVGKVEPHPANR